MARATPRTDDRISAEITALASLSIAQLKERWKVLYGTEPPLRASRDFVTRSVAYRI